VNPAIKLEPLEGAEPKLKVGVLLPEFGVMLSGPLFSVAVPSFDFAASLQMRISDQCAAAAVTLQNASTSKNCQCSMDHILS
jgi:hypothetical protein